MRNPLAGAERMRNPLAGGGVLNPTANKDQTGSIHRIGAIIQQTPSCNGWKFWYITRGDRSVLIDDLRSEYFKKKHEI
jgi:hypothetical protein